MEGEKRKIELEKRESEIVYSNSIRAGRRIYYLDVKTSRNGDMYLAITESKKRINGSDDDIRVSYEKHKIFLYKEDFDNFSKGLEDVINFIKKEQGDVMSREEYYESIKSDNPTDEAVGDEEIKEETKKSFFDKFKF